jgi:GAF domain-containing protein
MSGSDDLRRDVSARGRSGNETNAALLGAIVDRARRIFGAQACSILVHEPESRLLVFAAMSGEGSESLIGVKIPDTTGVAGWVLAAREPLFLEDVASDRRFAEDTAETIGYVPKRLMAMPLLLADRALGVLEVLDGFARARFTVREIDQLGDFANEAALALAQEHRER